MQIPNVKTVVDYENPRVRFVMLAYRHLTKFEAAECISAYMSHRRRKKLKNGEQIEIHTTIGAD